MLRLLRVLRLRCIHVRTIGAQTASGRTAIDVSPVLQPVNLPVHQLEDCRAVAPVAEIHPALPRPVAIATHTSPLALNVAIRMATFLNEL